VSVKVPGALVAAGRDLKSLASTCHDKMQPFRGWKEYPEIASGVFSARKFYEFVLAYPVDEFMWFVTVGPIL
jgi:hypothetical protein